MSAWFAILVLFGHERDCGLDEIQRQRLYLRWREGGAKRLVDKARANDGVEQRACATDGPSDRIVLRQQID